MKKRVVFFISLVVVAVMFGVVSASQDLELPDDDGFDSEIPDVANLCEGVNCEDGFVCEGGSGKCISTFEAGPYVDPGEGLDSCVSKCKSTYKFEDGREKCIEGCKGDFVSRGELRCLSCGDSCAPYDFVVSAMCPPPTAGEPRCGVESDECVVLGFEDHFEDEVELKRGAGITPDSAFYFIDKFFSGFGSDLDNKEEKVAEIKAMVLEGNFEAAREALDNYGKYAKELEREVNPEDSEETRRSAVAIRNTLREIEENIPEEDRDEFVYDIIEREGRIVTAAEIAGKIKSLCTELAKLDPGLFYDNCRTNDDGPKWQKDMFEDLTAEQEKEAKNFAGIMKQCFRTSGQDCACEEIPFTAFANACSVAAPLATACDLNGNEEACDKLDNLEMPELPPHLQNVFDILEGDVGEEQMRMHMPRECVEAGVTSPRECGKVMIKMNAPEECKEALLVADVQSEREGREICEKIMIELNAPPECREALLAAGATSEREGREICEKIMFEQHAPPECTERGIISDVECKDFMWGIGNRPQECQNNQIHDFRDCERFLRGGGQEGPGGPRIDFDCRNVQDAGRRLECYDGASSQAGSFNGVDDGNYEGPCLTDSDWQSKKSECRAQFGEHAGDEPIMGDSGKGYDCPVDIKCVDFGQGYDDDFDDFQGRDDFDDFQGRDDFDDFQGRDDFRGSEGPFGGDGTSCNEGYESDGQGGCIPFGTGDYGFEDQSPGDNFEDEDVPQVSPDQEEHVEEESHEPEQEELEVEPTVTGNAFLDYSYYN